MADVHVCHIIHSLGAGGAEQVIVDLARVGPDVGMRVSVVGLVTSEDSVHARTLSRLGVEVHTLGLSSRWDPRAFSRASRVVGHLQPDVVHTHLKHADIVGAVVARRLHVPLVSTLHLIEDNVSVGGRGKRWLAGLARRHLTDRTVAVSEAQRRWYLATFPAKESRVVTLHNGVLPYRPLSRSERVRVRAELRVPPAAVLAANVAIMRPGKGHDDLLAAVTMLPEDSPVVVALIGDGAERARLEAVASDDPRIASRVRFLGYREDVPRILGATDLVVHPSHADALPTALIHALAAGVPIIASEVGGIPEVVGDKAGVLLPAGDPAALASEIDRLASDPVERSRMGDAGRARFAAMFDAHLWAARLMDLYTEVSEGERSA